MTRHERNITSSPTVCRHCGQLKPGTTGIPIAEAQQRYADHWGHKPELRWISAAAKRLGCYHRAGKRAFILARHWNRFLEEAGKWGSVSASESIANRTGRKSSTRASASPSARKMARLETSLQSEALALAKG